MYNQVRCVFTEYYRAIDSGLEFITNRRQMHDRLSVIHQGLLEQVATLRPVYQGKTAEQFFSRHQKIAAQSRMLLIQMTQGHDEWTPRLLQLREETAQHEQAMMRSLGDAPSMLWEFLEPHFSLPNLQNIITLGQQSVPEHPVAVWERLMPQPLAQPLEFIEDEANKFISGFLGQVGMTWNEANDVIAQFGNQLYHTLDFMHIRSDQLRMAAADMPCGGNSITTLDPFLDGTEQRPYPKNMQDLYNVIDYQYHRSVQLHSGTQKAGLTPVGITPIGNNTIMVSLVGIEPINTNSNNWINGVGAGAQKNSATDPYEEDVAKIIQDYLNQNGGSLKKPVRIIIAAHSYGGIVAQEMAANHAKEKDYYLSDVVTFGAPEIGSYNRKDNVQYTQYFTQHDVVPMASGEEAWPHITSLTQSLGAGGDQNAGEDALVETGLLALDINKGNDPNRKQQWTAIDGNPGETPLTDETMNVTDFGKAHGAYSTSSQLARTPLPSDWPPITGSTWGKTSFYTVTQTGSLKDIYDPNVDDYITPTPLPVPTTPGPVPTQPTPTPGHH